MKIYINGMGAISPQHTHNGVVLKDGLQQLAQIRNDCVEPEYGNYIDPKQIRRMSRIVRMSVVASKQAQQDAGIETPDAIIVGTAFGCLEDTYSFLSKLVQFKEDMLSPTAFIHSTHNTIASQIALLFQCRGYNSTYVHKNISFESALLDGQLLIHEGTANQVLVGGVDEIIDAQFSILNRMGSYKKENKSPISVSNTGRSKGTIAGEGSIFFSLSSTKKENCYAEIKSIKTLSFSDVSEFSKMTQDMLHSNNIPKPDLVLAGYNGDVAEDAIIDEYLKSMDLKNVTMAFKNYCGEYGTASAFALWLASSILKEEKMPEVFNLDAMNLGKIKNILIYNHLGNVHHSLILVSAC